MLFSDPHQQGTTPATSSALQTLKTVSFAVAAVLASASLIVFGGALIPLATFAAATAIVSYGLRRSYPHTDLGACNVVTLARLAMVSFLLTAVFSPGTSVWLVFSVAVLAFVLDGLDGWLARREGLTSAFGARFDMETDAALAAVLATWVLVDGTVGAEVLVLGFARYAFVVAGFIWPKLTAELPPSVRRKAICVVQISALLTLLFPLTPAALEPAVSTFAALLLIWSFAIDSLWLLRRPA